MASLSAGLHPTVRQSTDAAPVDFSRLPRTYANALHLLSQLPTNRDVTSLFEIPKPKDGTAPVDFNALAIPEVVAWMARAGYADLPNDLAPLKCIHIAGTKGKGSVSAFATAILVEARGVADATLSSSGVNPVGRVGTYLSPHVVSVRERIWLDGQPISRDLFTQYTFELWVRLSEAAAAADLSEPDPYGAHTKPFYFRFLTLLAFHVFLREGVRSAVIECGIGGEYDATNILPASSVTAAAVTRLGIDHVAMLGRTLEEIAWHKAGIFKEGVAAFTLQQRLPEAGQQGGNAAPGESAKDREAALVVLRKRATEKKAQTLYEIPPQAVARWNGVPDAALPGSFQKYNMALAAAAARHHLRAVGANANQTVDNRDFLDPSSMPANFCVALAKAVLRGRCETVHDKSAGSDTVEYLVDGAHTADSLGEVARFFFARQKIPKPSSTDRTLPPRRILLFSVRDRSPGDLVRDLLAGAGYHDFFDYALFVFPPEASASREDALLAMRELSPGTVAQACDSVPAAIGQIRAFAAAAGRSAGTPASSSADAAADTLAATAIARPQPCQVLATGSFVLVREVLQELGAGREE